MGPCQGFKNFKSAIGESYVNMSSIQCAGFAEDKNPAKLALEWGVRRLNEALELRTRAGHTKQVIGDFFPAYDDDGGLLVALTPRLV